LPKNVQKLLTNGNQFFEFMVILGEQYIGEMYLAFRKLNSKEIASPEDKAIYVQQKSTQYEALVKNYRAGLNLPELKSDVLIAITMGLACVIAPLAVESHDKYEEAVKKEKLAANRKAVRTDLQEMLNESKLLNDLKTDETIWLDLGYHCGNYKRIDDLPIPEVKQEKKKEKKTAKLLENQVFDDEVEVGKNLRVQRVSTSFSVLEKPRKIPMTLNTLYVVKASRSEIVLDDQEKKD